MSPPSFDADFAKDLAKYADVITGFALAQVLLLGYNLGKKNELARTQAIRDALETFRATVEAGEMTGFKDGGLGRMAAGKQSVGTGSANRIENTDD
jgi:hypothetical protein